MAYRWVFAFCFLVIVHFLVYYADARHKQVDASLIASWDGTPVVLEALEFLVCTSSDSRSWPLKVTSMQTNGSPANRSRL